MSRKNRYIKLTEEKRQQLESAFRVDGRPVFRQRCHYILLSDQGQTLNDITATYGVCRQSVAKWFNKYEASGIDGLATREGQGNKPILCIDNKKHIELVKNLVDKHPQNLDPVLAKLETKIGTSLSKRTLTRFLKKLAIVGNVSDEYQKVNLMNKNTKLKKNNSII